jgi:transcriptional regulator with XRE-family HTH domain
MKVTKYAAQNAFSQRLYQEFKRAGLPMHSPTEITRFINRRVLNGKVSTQAVRKWLYHGVYPSQDKIMNLAHWLGISEQWLRFGTGDRILTGVFILHESNSDYHPEYITSLLAQQIIQLPAQQRQYLEQMLRLMQQDHGYTPVIERQSLSPRAASQQE